MAAEGEEVELAGEDAAVPEEQVDEGAELEAAEEAVADDVEADGGELPEGEELGLDEGEAEEEAVDEEQLEADLQEEMQLAQEAEEEAKLAQASVERSGLGKEGAPGVAPQDEETVEYYGDTPALAPEVKRPAVFGAEVAAGSDSDLDDPMENVEEHLREAVEGSFRQRRLLEQDDQEQPAAKRRRVASNLQAVNSLLLRWGLSHDEVVKHVLKGLTRDELNVLAESSYMPDKFNVWKSAAELLSRYICEVRERRGPGGGPLDTISSFKFRWKLDAATDKVLRGLTHKRLRYVLNNYDGSRPVEELASEAEEFEADADSTATALPDAPGVTILGRFNRLELIDPCADCAVFGDANLTFAKKLAQHRKGLGHVGRVIATTFEDLVTLRERYKEIDDSISVLESHFAEVHHGVDCTRIAVDQKFAGMEGSLGAVYYNFPHSGAVGGFFDGHPLVNWRHENLMRLFFRALRTYLKPGGSVKVASNMGAVGVRYSYIMESAIQNEFVHVETVPFLEWHLHRYGRSYGDRRDAYKRPDAEKNESYNSQRAEADMVYCFCFAPSGEKLPQQMIRLPPSKKTLSSCQDGPFKNLTGDARNHLATQLHKRFITECSGTHVG